MKSSSTTIDNTPNPTISTYFGTFGVDGLNCTLPKPGVASPSRQGEGVIFVTGYFSDNLGVVAAVNSALRTVNWVRFFYDPIHPGHSEMAGIAFYSPMGGPPVLYAAGSIANGHGEPNPTNGWIVGLNPDSGNDVYFREIENVRLSGIVVDESGGVYVNGWTVQGGTRRMIMMKYGSTLPQTPVYSTSFSSPTDSLFTNHCQSIAVDEAGNTYHTGVRDVGADHRPLYFRLNASGTNVDWSFMFENQTPGPNGGMNGVVYKRQDPGTAHIYMTGDVHDAGGTPLEQDMLLVKANASTGSQVWAWRWLVTTRDGPANSRVGDWQGKGIAVLVNFEPVVTGGAYDPIGYPYHGEPPTRAVDVCTTHFNANGDNTMRYQLGNPENCFGGSQNDFSVGLNISMEFPFPAIIVGRTASEDFPTTPQVYQSAYAGPPTDGFISLVGVQV